MLSIIKSIFLLFFLFFGQSPCYGIESQQHMGGDLVPVVNQQVKQNTISQHGLSAIFKMRLHKWKDNSSITVYVLADDSPLHQTFCKKILNVFPHQMRRFWDRLVFSGSGQAPVTLQTENEMLEMLATTPGAIGYLRADRIVEGIKALSIQSGSNP